MLRFLVNNPQRAATRDSNLRYLHTPDYLGHAFTNNVIQRCYFQFGCFSSPGYPVNFCNNLLLNTSLQFGFYGNASFLGYVTLLNNLLVHDSFLYATYPGYTPLVSNNGYYSTAVTSYGANPQFITDLDFQTGLLGPYYYPLTGTGGGLSQLFDAGNNPSANLDLDGYTTRVDQFPDYDTVDIGFHYKIGSLTTSTNATALQLAQMLVPPWVTVANANYTGAVEARGTFSGGNGCGLPIDSGVILSSGNITNAIGPNNDPGSYGNNGDLPGDSDLDNAISSYTPYTTHDAAILEFDIISPANSIAFQYVFALPTNRE
jgi:hypothetical protein